MKSNLFLAALCCAIVGLSGVILAGDDIQQVYNDFRQTMEPLRQQMFEKQQELGNEFNSEQRDENKIKQLYRDIADIRSQIAIAQSNFQEKIDAQAPNYPGYGMHHPGEFGPGDMRGMGRGMGPGMMMGGGCMMMGGGYGHGGRGGHHGW